MSEGLITADRVGKPMPYSWSRVGSRAGADALNRDAPLTVEFAKSILDYDPQTGIFLWKCRPGVSGQWNGRYAGRVAGSINDAYVVIRINKKGYTAQRLAWLMVTGEWPVNEVDHKDLNKKNNAWDNLRDATSLQNKHNTTARITNSSGFKCVFRYRDGKRWQASIRFNGTRKWLGIFDTPEDAHAAYCKAASELHGEFARG